MNMANTWAEAEFESIFSENFARIVRIVRRVVRCEAEAEEVCAEAFLKLYRMGPGAITGDTAGAWLCRVATRTAIDSLRRQKRRGLDEELDASQQEPPNDSQSDPLDRLIREERISIVRSSLAALKVEKAQALLLRHSGFSYQEIAAAMRIKPASVGTMLARAEAEFTLHYQRQERLRKRAPHLQTAKVGS
jgi:RNA polymerase sigma-70 factor (ECF subfamily)